MEGELWLWWATECRIDVSIAEIPILVSVDVGLFFRPISKKQRGDDGMLNSKHGETSDRQGDH